jgi:23S rRNA pseudouridine1911/1915/1917 synthase
MSGVSRPYEILFEDDSLLVVNKPAGLLAVPESFDKSRPNLFAMLQAERPGQWLANVHRLDLGTSGVFVCAKSPGAFREFQRRVAGKFYVALVHGAAGPALLRRRIAGREAVTLTSVRERFDGYTLLEVEIKTGRTHQIRIHLQAAGTPVVGDAEYGGAPLYLAQIKRGYKPPAGGERALIARPALHAERLVLRDPPVTFTAPWPKDLTLAVKYLRKYARCESVRESPG